MNSFELFLFLLETVMIITIKYNIFIEQADIHDHLSQRRSSYNIEYGRHRGTGSGSASKVDLLKSALEINHKASNSSVMSKAERTSNQSLNRYRADSAPKLNLNNPKSLLIPSTPVLEVIIRSCNYAPHIISIALETIALISSLKRSHFLFTGLMYALSFSTCKSSGCEKCRNWEHIAFLFNRNSNMQTVLIKMDK